MFNMRFGGTSAREHRDRKMRMAVFNRRTTRRPIEQALDGRISEYDPTTEVNEERRPMDAYFEPIGKGE